MWENAAKAAQDAQKSALEAAEHYKKAAEEAAENAKKAAEEAAENAKKGVTSVTGEWHDCVYPPSGRCTLVLLSSLCNLQFALLMIPQMHARHLLDVINHPPGGFGRSELFCPCPRRLGFHRCGQI